MSKAILGKLQKTLKNRVQLLLKLVFEANIQIELLINSGYEVEIEVWGSMGGYATKDETRLVGCTKDVVRSDAINRSTNQLKTALSRVTKELKVLEGEGYCVGMTSKRPNGCIDLFVDYIQVGLLESDFGMCQIPPPKLQENRE